MLGLLKATRILALLIATALLVLCIMSWRVGPMSSARMRLFHIDEGDYYLSLRGGRIETSMFTPWDGKWYPQETYSLATGLAYAIAVVGATFVVAPLFRLRPFQRTSDVPHGNTGSCDNCGYLLIGNQSGVCPECGTPVGTGRRTNADAGGTG